MARGKVRVIEPVPKVCARADCCRAGQMLPPSEFGLDNRASDGLSIRCKECSRIASNSYSKKRKTNYDMRNCTTRDPLELAEFRCPICGMWASYKTGKAFRSQAEALECCAGRVEHTVPNTSKHVAGNNIAKYDQRGHDVRRRSTSARHNR